MRIMLTYTGNGRAGGAVLTATRDGEPVLVDTVNLLKHDARADFLRRMMAVCPDADAGELESTLLGFAADLAKPPEKPAETSAPDSAALLGAMPEAVRAEARAMLESPDLFKRILDDIGALRVAGERELAATLYLAGCSRLLAEPLAVIIQGPTASGKSYILRKVASLFPPEAVLQATQLTPNALFYLQPGSLVHRLVVVGERRRAEDDDAADATRALREMLSEGRLSKLLPVKADGRQTTILIEQDGPIAYIETTTLSKVFDEDSNRCVLITSDERHEQTRNVLTTLAGVYSKVIRADTRGIIARHHALQRMLEPLDVVVPYALRLADAIDDHRVEARRAFPQVIATIMASTLLHQQQRQVDADGLLQADADDYAIARHLLAGPMIRRLGGGLSDPARRFLDRLRQWFPSSLQTFSRADARRKEDSSQSAVYGWFGELVTAGLLEQAEARAGNRAAQWRLSADAPEPDSLAVLPPVEKVAP